MKEAKKFKVNPDLLDFLEIVLTRSNIQYEVNPDNTVSVAVSGSLFHKFIIRARCEKLDYEKEGTYVTRPHVHVSELTNSYVMNNLSVKGNLIQVIGSKKSNK